MKSEAVVQSEIRAEAGRLGILLWRNNVGACTDETGRTIRYGLGNDSPQVQRRLKSSDLIGCVSENWGKPGNFYTVPVGRFIAVECKAEGWKFPDLWRGLQPSDMDAATFATDKARTLAQWRYLKLVHDAGGLAGFAQSVDDFKRILAGELVLP